VRQVQDGKQLIDAACQTKEAKLINERCSLDDVRPHYHNVHVYQLQACSNNPASNDLHPARAFSMDGGDRSQNS